MPSLLLTLQAGPTLLHEQKQLLEHVGDSHNVTIWRGGASLNKSRVDL
jgi:hypothetical protein